MTRGTRVTHFIVVMEAQRKWQEAYLDWLSKRRYTTVFPSHPMGFAPPIIREIRFYDISVPKGSVENLLGELAPFNIKDSYLGKKFGTWFNILRKFIGLDAVPEIPGYYNFRKEHKEDISVTVVGSKEDNWINGNMELI